jgi:hypothetical protein
MLNILCGCAEDEAETLENCRGADDIMPGDYCRELVTIPCHKFVENQKIRPAPSQPPWHIIAPPTTNPGPNPLEFSDLSS